MSYPGRAVHDFPAALSAGDSWLWTTYLDRPVATGSTLIYTIRAGSVIVNCAGTLAADGSSFAFVLAPADTSALSPGICPFSARLTVGSVVSTIRTGQLRVFGNLADPNAETRTPTEIELAAVQATLGAIRRRANGSYSGGGTSYTVAQISALRNEEYILRMRVNAEQGRSGSVKIRTAFRQPCGVTTLAEITRRDLP